MTDRRGGYFRLMRRNPVESDDFTEGFCIADVVVNVVAGTFWYRPDDRTGWTLIPGVSTPSGDVLTADDGVTILTEDDGTTELTAR